MAAVAVPQLPPLRPGSGGGAMSARGPASSRGLTGASPRGAAPGAGPGRNDPGQFNAHLTFNSARGPGGGPGAGGHNEQRDKLRSKLIDVGQRFVGFDKVIEDDTVKRRDTEMQRIAAAQDTIMKLERALNSEIKRRVDANKQVQVLTEKMANDMLDRLQSHILVRIEKLASSAESLTLRTTALEKGIAQFQGELPSKLQVDTAALVKEITELRKHMDLDCRSRIEKDTALLRRLAELESSTATKFEQGLAALKRDTESAKAEIDGLARTEGGDDTRTEKFRAFMLEEIAGMKNTLAATAQARENTDDEIVQAMNQYTNALQKGLHAANNGHVHRHS